MRVVLVGPAWLRQRLRSQLPADVLAVSESATIGAGRRSAAEAYACVLLAPDAADAPLIEPLTPRERQVLELVADGLPNKAIAARLGIGAETVKFHLGSIFGKLGASNRTDAVRIAIKRGLISV